ncbi:MAG: hypothetical protein KGI19_07470 [Thaumarchaeota archaeon]|nr:hypothetical protein [Nitrososphaerota archaeon]MDE1818426.1 hypothetical protein [Nitrososphaerota archaeon]
MRKIYLIMLAVSFVIVFILPIFTGHDFGYYFAVGSYAVEVFVWDMIIISSLQVSKYNKIPKMDVTKTIKQKRVIWKVLQIFFIIFAIGEIVNILKFVI